MKHQLMIRTLTIFLLAFLCLFQFGAVSAAPGDLDTTFAGTGKVRTGFNSSDDVANAAAVQADGKLVVVGSTINGAGLDFLVIRYNTDGSLDTSFDDDGKAITPVGFSDDVATAVAIQPDGKIVVAGYCIGNRSYDFAIVRYNTDGSLDLFFGISGKEITAVTEFTDEAHSVAIQPDGKIVVVGHSLSNNFDSDFALARYNPNGSLDSSFAGNGILVTPLGPNITQDRAEGVAIQPDGKIVVVGRGNDIYDSFLVIVRFTPAGFFDFSFFVQGKGTYQFGDSDWANAVALQPDGKIVLAGVSDGNFLTMRFTTNGLFDNSFNGNGRAITPIGSGFAEAKAVMFTGTSDPKIVVAGYNENGANKDFAVVRYNLDGSLDTTFSNDGKVITQFGAGDDVANAVAMQAGRIVVAGSTTNGSSDDFALVRYNTDGSLDTSFDDDGKRTDDVGIHLAIPKGAALQPDGKLVVAGNSDTDSNNYDFAVARYNSDGSLDTSFDGDGRVTTDLDSDSHDEGNAVAIQADGKIVVAGSKVSNSSGSSDFAVVRYNANGSRDTSFNGNGKVTTPVGADNDVGRAVALQADGKIVVVGSVEVGSGKSNFGVVRYNPNGSLDTSFNGNGKVITFVGADDDEATAVKIQADGKIVVAGISNNGFNGDFAIVRYNPNGSPDTSFGSFGKRITPIGLGDDIASGMAIQADGRIVVAGYSSDGTDANFAVVRYTASGSLDNSFDDDGIVTTPIFGRDFGVATAIQADGKIIVAGATVAGSNIDFALVRYNPDGSLDTSFGLGGKTLIDVSGIGDSASAIVLDSIGRAVVVGYAGGMFGVVRLSGDQGGNSSSLQITSISISGKKLFIEGQGFDSGAAILLNGAQQKTINDAQNPTGRLIGQKAGKKVVRGQTVVLKVRNSDGEESAEFIYTRPAP